MEDSNDNFINIRISLNTKKKEVISLSKNALNHGVKGIKLSAVGSSINKLVNIVEFLKILIHKAKPRVIIIRPFYRTCSLPC